MSWWQDIDDHLCFKIKKYAEIFVSVIGWNIYFIYWKYRWHGKPWCTDISVKYVDDCIGGYMISFTNTFKCFKWLFKILQNTINGSWRDPFRSKSKRIGFIKSLVACRTSVTSGMIINETRGSGNNRMFYFLIYVIDNFSCSGLANRATLFSVYKFQDNMDTIFSMEDIVMFNDVTINTKYF